MRTLRYSINVTLDGCVHHEAVAPDEELHRYFAESLARADALLFGRVVYQMMEEAWRREPWGTWPEWMDDWMVPFAEAIDAADKHVVSSTLEHVDWNAELLQGDLETAVRELKAQPGRELQVHGSGALLRWLLDHDLVDELNLWIYPVVLGDGLRLFPESGQTHDLKLLKSRTTPSGVTMQTYRPAGRATFGTVG